MSDTARSIEEPSFSDLVADETFRRLGDYGQAALVLKMNESEVRRSVGRCWVASSIRDMTKCRGLQSS